MTIATHLRVLRRIVADATDIKILDKSPISIKLAIGQPQKMKSPEGETMGYPKQLIWTPDGTWRYLYLSAGLPAKGDKLWLPIGNRQADGPGNNDIAMYQVSGTSNTNKQVVLTLVSPKLSAKGAPPKITMDLKEFQTNFQGPSYWKERILSPEAMKKILGYDPADPEHELKSPEESRSNHGMKQFFEQAIALVKREHSNAMAEHRKKRQDQGDASSNQFQKNMSTYGMYMRSQGEISTYKALLSFLDGFDGDSRTVAHLTEHLQKRKEQTETEAAHLQSQLKDAQERKAAVRIAQPVTRSLIIAEMTALVRDLKEVG